MSAIERRQPGQPSWSVLTTTNIEGAREFYSELFDWEITDSGPAADHHHTVQRGGKHVAAMKPGAGAEGVNAWGLFLATDDAAATHARALELGARSVQPPLQVGELGSMAGVVDPAGALVFFWQAGTFGGAEVVAEVGAPVYHDLHAVHYRAAGEFYAALFDLEIREVEELKESGFNYALLGPAGGPTWFGIMDVAKFYPEGSPSVWNTYFGVDDVQAAFDWALDRGASEMIAPVTDLFGTYATVMDPYGAPLYICRPDSSY